MALAFVAACSHLPQEISPPVTASPPGTAEEARATGTPALAIDLSPVVVAAGGPGQTTVLGLISNRSGQAVDNLRIRVSLLDPSGRRLGQRDIPPALTHLDAADVSPFAATFPVTRESGMQASAELTQYRTADSANTPLQAEIVQIERLPDGSTALLGRLTNPGGSTVRVRELAVLALDAQGLPTGLLPWSAGPIRIGPRGSQPFVAIGPAHPTAKAHIAYARAEVETGEHRMDMRFAAGPDLHATSQGEWFITGALENLGSRPAWGQAALRIEFDQRLLGLAQVRFPLPLTPGEIRPFSVRMPPLFGPLPASLDPAELSLNGKPESWPASSEEAALVLLDIQIESFEFTGSRAFIRGRVANPTAQAVATPTVFAAVRSTEGKILGAFSQVLAPDLPPSAERAFTLSIDLPAQATPAMAEYDLRALGVEAED
jgi:hypothetical protein